MRKIWTLDRSSGVQQTAEEVADSAADRTDSTVSQQARRLLAEQIPVLREVARGLCRDATQIEDLVQDVFEKALRSIHMLKLEKNPRGWMVRILYNLHIDRCRKLARLGQHIPCDDVPLMAPDPVDAPMWSTLTADDVRRVVAELPAELRDAYTMFAFEGRTYVEIAAALGIPKATVGTRVLRARTHLKKLLLTDLRSEKT